MGSSISVFNAFRNVPSCLPWSSLFRPPRDVNWIPPEDNAEGICVISTTGAFYICVCVCVCLSDSSKYQETEILCKDWVSLKTILNLRPLVASFWLNLKLTKDNKTINQSINLSIQNHIVVPHLWLNFFISLSFVFNEMQFVTKLNIWILYEINNYMNKTLRKFKHIIKSYLLLDYFHMFIFCYLIKWFNI